MIFGRAVKAISSLGVRSLCMYVMYSMHVDVSTVVECMVDAIRHGFRFNFICTSILVLNKSTDELERKK